jgi:uncharacterized protein YraI
VPLFSRNASSHPRNERPRNDERLRATRPVCIQDPESMISRVSTKEHVMNKIIQGVAALALCAPMFASAAEAFVVADIGLQAGPDSEYPLIEELGAGTTVTVEGCIAGWTWCDVVVSNGDRGWVPGTFLEELYGGQRVVLIDYGPRIGIPVVSFSLGTYWDRHYHSRPFYSQRGQWETRHIAVRTPPRAPAAATTSQHAAAPVTTRQAPTSDRRETAVASTRRQQQPSRPQLPETKPAPETAPPQANPEQQPEQHRATPAPRTTAVRKAEPRTDEPKPKDELQRDNRGHPKKGDDDKDGGGG